MMETKLRRILATVFLLHTMLLPALALAQQPGEVMPTGDALYDRLQQAVLDEHRFELAGFVDYNLLHYRWTWAPAVATVESWEGEFGERSDYWCLLAYARAAESGRRSLETALLRRAADCVDAGDAVRQLLFRKELDRIWDDGTLDAWQDEELNREVIGSWRRLYPGKAWVCYEAADHLAGYEMDRRWLELMELGNSLPVTAAATELFPLSFVQERLASGEEIGNQAVAGSVLAMRMTLPDSFIIQYIGFKDSYKEMIVAGCAGGIERGMTALSRRELRCRSASGVPWLCCTPQVAGIMPPAVLESLHSWLGDDQPKGFTRYMQDFAQFNEYGSGIHRRLAEADPGLAQYLASNPHWSVLQEADLYPAFPEDPFPEHAAMEGLGILLGQLNELSMYGSYEQEYRLNRYLMDHEVPHCQEMLQHLATFDFAHPEAYVAMEETE